MEASATCTGSGARASRGLGQSGKVRTRWPSGPGQLPGRDTQGETGRLRPSSTAQTAGVCPGIQRPSGSQGWVEVRVPSGGGRAGSEGARKGHPDVGETSLDNRSWPWATPALPGACLSADPSRQAGMGAWPGLPAGPPSALRGVGLTCDVLTPGVIQVRGQHVPHGKEEPRGPIRPPPAAACAAQTGAAGAMEPARPAPAAPGCGLCPASAPAPVASVH